MTNTYTENHPQDNFIPGGDIHATELDSLAGTDTPPEGDGAGAPEQAPGQMSNGQTCTMALEMLATVGAMQYPSIKRTATQDKLMQAGESLGAVLDKYGVNAGGWLAQYAVELNALACCGSLGFAVYAGMREDTLEREAAAAAKKPEPVEA